MKAAIFILALFLTHSGFAQERPPQEAPFINDDADIDSELDSANGPVQIDRPTPTVPAYQESRQPIIPVTPSTDVEPQFVKPPGPKQGGTMRVPHPNAAKGLLRINKDGTYQYRTALKPKSHSSSLRFGQMTPPSIIGSESAAGTLTYESMYGSNTLLSINFDYEWQPFVNFGRLGINFGTGFATARANGYFKNARAGDLKAEEVYNLYVIPASLFLTYRFEYKRRQWLVPFINGGVTYYGLAEARDDSKEPTFAGAPAAGGGGGLMFSITAWDAASAFSLDREYGIADMYFTLEARAMQGLDPNIDFTTQSINGGITVDF